MPEFTANTIQLHIAAWFEEIEDFKFLLLKRAEHLRVYPGIWQAITGTIEGNEMAVQTAVRELKEETGVEPLKFWTVPYMTSFFNPLKDAVNFSPVFGCLFDKSSEIRISSEHQDHGWFTLEEADKLLILPSHSKGNHVFNDYILKNTDNEYFEFNIFGV